MDALLQTADAVYCVNLTDDRLEQNFLKKEEQEKSQAFDPKSEPSLRIQRIL